VSPKLDTHWSTTRNLSFSWRYNGQDLQYQYRIQIFKLSHTYLRQTIGTDQDPVLWFTDTNTENSNEILVEARDELTGYISSTATLSEYVYDTGAVASMSESVTINLDTSSFSLSDDGIYIWRIQTRGTVSINWSDWSNDGLVRLDAGVPVFYNLTSDTSHISYPSISTISDLSCPYMERVRTAATDIGIDGTSSTGLYIYYDYNEEAIILRCRGLDTGETSTKRFYGQISFHADSTDGNDPESKDADFYPDEVVEWMSVYKINRDAEDGPSDELTYKNSVDLGEFYSNQIRHLIYKEDQEWYQVSGFEEDFLPKGFPKLLYTLSGHPSSVSVYNEVDGNNHPSVKSSTENFITQFPFNTYLVPADRSFIFPGQTEVIKYGESGDTDLIEMRFPYPFQDVFILFSNDGGNPREVLAYGQYINWDDALGIDNNITYTGPFGLVRGWNVEASRAARTKPTGWYDIFTDNSEMQSNHPFPVGSRTINERLSARRFSDSGGNLPAIPYSPYMFFNLSPEVGKDNVIKIKINPRFILNHDGDFDLSSLIAPTGGYKKLYSVEFNMYPETDCCLASDSNYQKRILLDDVNIGKGKISPRLLSVFKSTNYPDTSSGKSVYKSVKLANPNEIRTTKTFAINTTDFSDGSIIFANDDTNFNGSFRIKIPPDYDYVPYYSQNTASFAASDGSVAPVPYIYEADPTELTDNVTRWDSFVLETSSVGTIDGKVKSDFIFSNDYVRFDSSSSILGQFSNFYTNSDLWNDLDNPKGKVINHHGQFYDYITGTKDFLDYGYFGYSIFYNGFSRDGIKYNKPKKGLFAVASTSSAGVGKTRLNLKDFSNYLLKQSVEFEYSGTSVLSSTIDFTGEIDTIDSTYSFGGETNVLNDGDDPTWLFNYSSDSAFKSALIEYDGSIHGNYGSAKVGLKNWIKTSGVRNSLGSQYLLPDSGTPEQIMRMLVDIPLSDDTTFVRGPLNKQNISVAETGRITGDTFSIGNVFGIIYPKLSIIRVFVDVYNCVSGIKNYRYFRQDIGTELVESSHHVGDLDISGDEKTQIKMQKLNNGDSSSSVLAYRSSISLVSQQMNNSSWLEVPNFIDAYDDVDETGVGVRRLSIDINLSTAGYNMVYVQLKNKAGTSSNICPISLLSSTSTTFALDYWDYNIQSAVVNVENAESFEVVDSTISDSISSTFTFKKHTYPSDDSSQRTIFLNNVLSDQLDEDNKYGQYFRLNNSLIGFSDDYGLMYNGYAPVASMNSWDFSRPLVMPMKPFSFYDRYEGPDWYFDPNHVRHYTSESATEIDLNKYLPYGIGNYGYTPITIIGIMEEKSTNNTALGKSNPIASKLKEFKEEFIGKKIVLGSDISQSFTILHIFESSNILPTNRSSFEVPIDADTAKKTWLVVEDPYAICAMVLSRKFQYYQIEDTDATQYDLYKRFTGWRRNISDTGHNDSGIDYSGTRSEDLVDSFGNRTVNFGYEAESSIDSDLLETVDSALSVDDDGLIPSYISNSKSLENIYRESFYISPTITTTKSSGLATGEGWISQIFKRYPNDGIETLNDFKNLNHSNIVGIQVFDKLVFGRYYITEGTIYANSSSDKSVFITDDTVSLYSVSYDGTETLVGDGRFDATMGNDGVEGLAYSITKNGSSVSTGTVVNVSENGRCIVLSGTLPTFAIGSTYKLRITTPPLQSLSSDETQYSIGWWPDVDGFLIPSEYNLLGTATETSTTEAQNARYAIVSTGSFFVEENGNYTFKVLTDGSALSDFCVDYMRHTSLSDVEGYVYNAVNGNHELTSVGGIAVKNSTDKVFYLRKGWHIGRFRYLSNSTSTFRHASVLYRKSTWGSSDWMPMIASRNQNKIFMKKGYRTVHCKLITENGSTYPTENNWDIDKTKESQYLRAILGFNSVGSLDTPGLIDKVAWITRLSEDSTSDNYIYGRVFDTSESSERTYGGQVFEEAYGYYESNIFDGGVDLRFWKEIKWTPLTQSDTTNMDVEFYVRTAPTEEELLNQSWNTTIGDNGQIVTFNPFTDSSGNNIVRFSHKSSSTDPNEVTINRFIQFRIVLRSRHYTESPRIDDVTIVYSKENSVNFFTTTFNMNSNMLRAILSYNGENQVDASQVALTDIQFGICTQEESTGEVSTDFDNYTIIPTNEVFALSSLGIQENDKFRVGIRFISSDVVVPFVDEFGILFESEGLQIQTKDLMV